jgi:phage portal protein BeeE
MPSLLTKLTGAGSAKGTFTQPPFWSWSSPIWDSVVGDKEKIEADFASYVHQAYKANGLVFACILTRLLVLSEARFTWRRIADGRPSQLFGNTDLAVLERPWRGGTTGELIARMEQDGSLAGNSFITKIDKEGRPRLRRLRPDWTTIVAGSESDDPYALDAEVIAYYYMPGGRVTGKEEILLPDEVAHYSPIPDPEAQFRGMSWLTPILRELEADTAATKHKLQFFKRGATPNVMVTYDKAIGGEAFQRFVALFKEQHEGVDNAYKTLHLGGGADAKVVGANLQQLDFKVTQGAGETRVAAAAGIHPVIVGLSEGLQGSSLNAGNFAAARRITADRTLRPLWRIMAASLETLLTVPAGPVELSYDARDVAFLREDAKDDADILKAEAEAINSLITAGYKPDAIIEAVTSGDLRRLAGNHSGRFSVQLQPLGAASSNGAAALNGAAAEDRKALVAELAAALQPKEPVVVHNHVAPAAPAPPAEVHIEKGAVQVEVAPPPPANVEVKVDVPGERSRRIERDASGGIARIVVEED